MKEKFQAAEKTRRRQPERNGWTRLQENYNHRFSAPGSTTIFYVFLRLCEAMSETAQVYGPLAGHPRASSPFSSGSICDRDEAAML